MSELVNNFEKNIDQRLVELESPNRTVTGDAFSRLLKRMRLRNEHESIAADYFSLIKNRTGSPHLGLKVLQVLEMVRARDIGLQAVRIASPGPDKRQPWKDPTSTLTQSISSTKEGRIKTLRTFRASHIPFRSFQRSLSTEAVDLVWENVSGTNILDLSNVLVLHLGFIGDDLVMALDANLELFIYGPAALKDRRIRAEAFSDYGYNALCLDPERVVYGPIVRAGVRRKLVRQAEQLHNYFDVNATYPEPEFFKALMATVEQLMGYQDLIDGIQRWADSKSRSLEEICLMIIPDESLFLLPLSFLGGSRDEPLITRLGGVANALSMLALKWAVKDYHWTTLPNLSAGSPRCSFFAVNGNPRLDLSWEKQTVSTSFGDSKCMVLGDSASRADFMDNYSAGDVCWFAGHGAWDLTHGIQVEGELLPFPLSGPCFSDGKLTNWDLISTSNWNFKMLWLTVMNCCVLGKFVMIGPNPLGFISAMHSVGSTALIAALWPVLDEAAISLAGTLSSEIVTNFHQREFPRARALRQAICKSIGSDKDRQWLFAPYASWGLP